MPVPQPWCQALRTGQDPRPHPPTISFRNVDSCPRIPNTPQSPTTLSALQSDVSCRASGSDYPRGGGRGLWWAQPIQPPQTLGGWSLSSKGAQLLLALISCGDFLIALDTPRRLRLWELRWLRKDGWSPHQPQLEPHPLKPLADSVYRMLDVCGVRAGEERGRLRQRLRGPLLTVFTTLRNPLPLSDPQFPHL